MPTASNKHKTNHYILTIFENKTLFTVILPINVSKCVSKRSFSGHCVLDTSWYTKKTETDKTVSRLLWLSSCSAIAEYFY